MRRAAPYVGIIQEGGTLPRPFDVTWCWCPECDGKVTVDRLTLGYEYHIEHVTYECQHCGAAILYFDVLTEASFTVPQLAATT